MRKTIYMDLRDEAVSSALHDGGVWEPDETSFVENTLRQGMVFVDVGAHIGYYTLIASAIVGDRGRVFAFEPDPRNFAFLQKNIRANHCQNVVTCKRAIVASSQRLFLYRSRNNFGDHRIYEPQDEVSRQHGRRRSAVAVEAISLDEYFQDNPTRIDFLKMDIQGAEYGAFIGMRKTLQQNPDIMILTEFWPKGLAEAGVPPHVFLDEARRCGFKTYRIDQGWPQEVSNSDILQSLAGDAYMNVIFSRRRLRQWDGGK